MALARKCNICNDYYDNYNVKPNSNKVNGFAYVNIDEYGYIYRQKANDCCPTCMKAIQTFVTRLEDRDIPTATELALRELHDVQQVGNARACLLAIDCNDDMTKARMREYVDEAISYLDAALIGTTTQPET